MTSEMPEKARVFDPEKALEEVKALPRSERRAAFADFREQHTRQREGLIEMQNEISDILMEDPDASQEKLQTVVEAFNAEYGFSESQRAVAQNVLERYRERHAAVSAFRSAHPEDQEIYEAIFQEKPHGDISISEGPVSLYMRCKNPRDYMNAYAKLSGGEQKVSLLKKLRSLFGTLGAASGGEPMPGLNQVILLENSAMHRKEGDADMTQRHEEQHSLNHLFREAFDEEEYFDRLLNAREPSQKLNIIQDYYRGAMEEMLKDEILAFMESGEFKWDVMRQMRDYYINKAMEPLKRGFLDDLKKIEAILQTRGADEIPLPLKMASYREAFGKAESVFEDKDYKRRLFEYLCDNISAYEKFGRDRGEGDAFALAINTPMRDWRGSMRRLKKGGAFPGENNEESPPPN